MKKNMSILTTCPLFDGMDLATIGRLVDCIKPIQKNYEKNSFILSEYDEPKSIGIVLKGIVHIVRDDYWGNRTIITVIEPGSLFAEALVCGGVKKSPVSVMAAEQSEIALFDFNRIVTMCSSACDFHIRLIKNMISILSVKNINLVEKIEHITRRGIRQKIVSYISSIAKRHKSGTIAIPFNRQGLADYLSVDRSALSAELCRMRDEGIISFRKNIFQILP